MLLTWIAPICPHTAEEAWEHIPKNTDKSIFYNKWIILENNIFDNCKISNDNWNEVLEIKKLVSKYLEEKRVENIIGSSLDADVVINCSESLYKILAIFGKELKFIFITSSVTLNKIKENVIHNAIEINNHKLIINIENSKNNKCDRCWHKCNSVGKNKNYNNICERCVSNVYGEGEIRKNA